MATAAKVKANDPEPTATELGNQAMAEAKGDVVQAARILQGWAEQNMDVWRVVTQDLLAKGCYATVSAVCRAERRVIYYTPGYSEESAGERVHKHANRNLDWPLPGGKRLRDATGSELAEAIRFYTRQAEQMQRVADWLAAIAERCKDQPVGQVLTEQELEQLKP